jgi:hypothetical protein
MGCGLAGSLLVLETTLDRRLEATDVALNSGSEAPIIRGEAQDGCCIAGTLRTEALAHAALLSLHRLLADVRLQQI